MFVPQNSAHIMYLTTRYAVHLWSPYVIEQTICIFILSFVLSFFLMAALCNRADHYISILFLSSFFISSPNLSGRRLDVYHTSTHGVALVQT